MPKRSELSVIDADTFYEGMKIDSEIYYQYERTFVLLCKNVVLDSELIMKLRRAADAEQEIYVRKEFYDPIVEMGMRHKQELRAAQGLPPEPKREPKPKPRPEPEPPQAYVPMDPRFKVEQAEPHLTDLQKKLKAQKEYQEMTLHTSAMLNTVAQTEQIPEELTVQLTDSVQERLETTDVSILLQCINSLRKVDDYLYAHSINVSMLNGLIGRWLGLTEEECQALVRTGLLHDIGKLKVPPEILNKPGRLTKEEYDSVKLHSVFSHEILLNSGEKDERVLSGVRSHHERMNGTGYPDGLKSEDIPLFARITAVSDVYDAMVAKRPYKERSSPFDILAEFATSRFSNLDMKIIDIFLGEMPHELVGKRVLLSDGSVAKVVYISASNFAYPMVKVGGKVITTNSFLKCVAMDNFVSVLPD